MKKRTRRTAHRKTVDFTAGDGNCYYPLGTLNWPRLPAGHYRMTMTVRRLPTRESR